MDNFIFSLPTKVYFGKGEENNVGKYLKEYHLKWCEVQISYAIGIKEPLSIMIDSNIGVINPDKKLYKECEPNNIIKDLNLLNKCYYDTAKYGHFIDYN